MEKYIISVLGHDRPGIIAAITKTLFDNNCNIENVSQTILQSEFCGTFIIIPPAPMDESKLNDILSKALSAMELRVHVKKIEPQAQVSSQPAVEPFVVTTQGPDRLGLVAGMSEVFAKFNANVTNLKAVFKGGDSPYDNIMIYEVDLPHDVDYQLFNQELTQKAHLLGLELNIQHRNIFMAINRI